MSIRHCARCALHHRDIVAVDTIYEGFGEVVAINNPRKWMWLSNVLDPVGQTGRAFIAYADAASG